MSYKGFASVSGDEVQLAAVREAKKAQEKLEGSAEHIISTVNGVLEQLKRRGIGAVINSMGELQSSASTFDIKCALFSKAASQVATDEQYNTKKLVCDRCGEDVVEQDNGRCWTPRYQAGSLKLCRQCLDNAIAENESFPAGDDPLAEYQAKVALAIREMLTSAADSMNTETGSRKKKAEGSYESLLALRNALGF